MKINFIIFCLFMVQFSNSQNLTPQQQLDSLVSRLNKNTNEILCVGNSTGSQDFKKIYRKVFSTVVLGKSDIISNGSAFSYSQDNNKNTFSINGAINPPKWQKWVLDMGVSIKSKDNNFIYYKKNAWANDITLKAGVSFQLTTGTLYYETPACELAKAKRVEFYNKKIEILAKKIDDINGVVSVPARVRDNNSDINEVEKLSDLNALKSEYDAEFEASSDFTNMYHGYSAMWLNLTGNYTNSSFIIENDSIMIETIQKKFSSISKYSIDANWNFHKKGNTNFFISQLGTKFNIVSLLDNPAFKDKKFKVTSLPNSDGYDIYYYDSSTQSNTIVGNYSDLDSPIMTFDLGGYVAWMRWWEQSVGINCRFNFNIPYGGNKVDFVDNYTFLAGGIFRLSKDKIFSTVTFTLNAGVENIAYDTNGWDNFIVKASAAIPFNVFEKKL